MLASDTAGNYGGLLRFKQFERINKVSGTTALASGGELSDIQHIKKELDRKHERDCIAVDGHEFFQPKDYANFLARMHYQRRCKMDPLYNSHILGGINSITGEKYLATVDMHGNIYEGNHLVTGLANYFCNVLLANEWKEDIEENAARELLEKCLRVLFYRDKMASDRIQLAKITLEGGVQLCEPYQISSEWDLESFKTQFNNEKTRDMKQFYYQ